ncbi:MAG: hypothetical protein A2901_07885 [Elusimicrobia bacterium RIFCSPLOWO2_01_FULL_54_10]|nr:MAG: hypothetical protein A2901_07885 [Elusimicrobia bacterium RIFCSPLOWO2_01_FULL_54_10]
MKMNMTLKRSGFIILALFCAGALRAASTVFNFPVNLNFPAPQNISLAPALTLYSVSSTYGTGYASSLAFDGNTTTRWSSAFSDPQWIMVNYGSVKTISRVVIQWEAAYARAYRIQVSLNGTTWTDVFTTNNGVGGTEVINITPVNAQYIRMYGTQRATTYGYSIYEMTVTYTTPQMIAQASSQQSAAFLPSYAVDANASTRWSSQFSDPQWLSLDFIIPRSFNQVNLSWEAAYARAYTLQTSNDGFLWTNIYTTTNGQGGQETIQLPNLVTTRFLRMHGTQRATAYGYSLYEMSVLTMSGPQPPSLPSAALTASPATLTSGQSATLTWPASTATSVSIDQGIGVVSASGGSRQVSPTATTRYTLTATNSAGSATASALVTVTDATPPTLPAGPSITIVPGREFAANSYVHRVLADNAPLDPKSAAWVTNIQGQISRYYNVAAVNISQYTPAIFIVGPNQPTVRVRNWDRNNPSWSNAAQQAKWTAVPLPDNFVAASGTDQEAMVYQPSTGMLWEFWLMAKTGARVVNSAGQTVDEWGARWGGRIDSMSTNPGYFLTEGGDWNTTTGAKYGTTATSLAFLAGIITIEEQQAGVINHVIGVALPEIMAYPRWSWPANRTDGSFTYADAIPEGAIFRLPANLNLDAMDMDPYARMIAKAVQRHGMVVWDKAGTVSFRAENPANKYPEGNPYTKAGGILNCPNGQSQQACWADSNGRLRGFPWASLQALQTQMNQ